MSDAQVPLGGTLNLGGDLEVHRLGFGAMRITGQGVRRPPPDHDTAIDVLRRTVELGISVAHLDENVAAASLRLTAAELSQLDAAA